MACAAATVPKGNAAVVKAIPVSRCMPLAFKGLTVLPLIIVL